MLSTFDNNKVQWNWSKFIKGGYIHFLQYVLGEKTVSKKIKCPTKEFQVHLLNMMLFCVLNRELTLDSPNAFNL